MAALMIKTNIISAPLETVIDDFANTDRVKTVRYSEDLRLCDDRDPVARAVSRRARVLPQISFESGCLA